MAAWAGIIVSVIGLVGGMMSASGKEEAAKHATNRQIDIANRVQYREQLLFQDWETQVKNKELGWAREVLNLPEPFADYHTAMLRASVNVFRQFSRPKAEATRCMNVRCVGATEAVQRNLIVAEGVAVAFARSTAVHAEDERVEFMRAQRDEEQLRALAAGHQKFFSTRGSAVAAHTFGQQARAAEKAAEQASRATGYFLQRAISGFDEMRSSNPQQRPEVIQQRENRSNTGSPSRSQDDDRDQPIDPWAISDTDGGDF